MLLRKCHFNFCDASPISRPSSLPVLTDWISMPGTWIHPILGDSLHWQTCYLYSLHLPTFDTSRVWSLNRCFQALSDSHTPMLSAFYIWATLTLKYPKHIYLLIRWNVPCYEQIVSWSDQLRSKYDWIGDHTPPLPNQCRPRCQC